MANSLRLAPAAVLPTPWPAGWDRGSKGDGGETPTMRRANGCGRDGP